MTGVTGPSHVHMHWYCSCGDIMQRISKKVINQVCHLHDNASTVILAMDYVIFV